MPSAFLTALSGLRSHARAVEVIANNLANLNTFAFKGSRAEFRDLFYQTIGLSRSGVASQAGLGVAPITVSRRFEQGTVQNTGGLLDAAIQGEGFFIVKDNDLVQYSRAGNFQLNTDRVLVTINGEVVQGWNRHPTTEVVNTNLPIADVSLAGNDTLDPDATSEISVTANLSKNLTTDFTVPLQVFDSLGESHILTINFAPVIPPTSAAGEFDVTVTIPADDVLDGANATPATDPNILIDGGVPAAVSIEFNGKGILINPNGAGNPYQLDLNTTTAGFTFANGAEPLQIDWSLLDSLLQPTLTNFATDSSVSDLAQDGAPPAQLTSISIADGGKINGLYSDGRTLTLAQLSLARFTNPQTLLSVGNNNFRPTSASGLPVTGPANTGGLGSVLGLSLEFSNVDIAQEFTNLLTFQRGFQANSRVITTADELNQEALNLKR